MTSRLKIERQARLQDVVAAAIRFHQQNAIDLAEQFYTEALALDPKCFDALHLLGVVRLQQNRPTDALALMSAALKVNRRSADALSNYATALSALEKAQEALAHYDQALKLNPNHLDALYNRGHLLQEAQRFHEAVATYDQVLKIDPNNLKTLNNRGAALQKLRRPVEALADLDKVLSSDPNHVEALSNRSAALQDLDRDEEALQQVDHALSVNPHYAIGLSVRGCALVRLNRHAEAIESFDAALAIDPDFSEARFNLALAQLALGDFSSGWKNYESREKTKRLSALNRNFKAPRWTGEQPLSGRTILLHAEQGLGDTIHFIRFADDVARMNARVIVEVQPSLKNLRYSFSNSIEVIERGKPLPDFDFHCPIMSLPFALNVTVDKIPGGSYLTVDSGLTEQWIRRFEEKAGPKIGLVWAGNPSHQDDRNRSIPLKMLTPLLESHNVVVLQKEISTVDLEYLKQHDNVRIIRDQLHDFADTVAAISVLDAVITVDTAVAHAAGALGKIVFLLLPYYADPRWLKERHDTPWYPNMRLVRQKSAKDWDAAVSEVCALLQAGGFAR